MMKRAIIGIVEGYGPGLVADSSPAAAGREAAEASDGVADGDSGGEDVGGQQGWHLIAAHVPESEGGGEDESALENACCLERSHGKNLFRVFTIEPKVKDEH
jgi:hypothetical protein